MSARSCSVDGCDRPYRAKGYCSPHYERWRAHGDPLGGRTARGSTLFFLESTVIPFDGDECLFWPFTRNYMGYGQIRLKGRTRSINRLVCEIEHGPPPTPKHEAAHLCGKGHLGCVNRKHLEWKTRSENEADKLVHGTDNRGERCGTAKLTEAQVLEIRASSAATERLARQFSVSGAAIRLIRKRQNWAWLEDAA